MEKGEVKSRMSALWSWAVDWRSYLGVIAWVIFCGVTPFIWGASILLFAGASLIFLFFYIAIRVFIHNEKAARYNKKLDEKHATFKKRLIDNWKKGMPIAFKKDGRLTISQKGREDIPFGPTEAFGSSK